MFGVPVEAHGEETLDFVAPGEESTIKWYINQDGVERIRAGLVCSNCLEPFPAPPDIRNSKIWRDHAHHYSKIRTEDEVMTLIVKNACPVCRTEVSPEMASLTFKGRDQFEPQKIEVPE